MTRFYPGGIERTHLEIVWYENGDFSLHYHEDHGEGAFDYRWDRHPSDHNTRDHVILARTRRRRATTSIIPMAGGTFSRR